MALVLTEFQLDESSTASVVVEAVPPRSGGPQRVARTGEILVRAEKTIQDALQALRPAISTITKSLRDINNPAEIELTFGIKLSADVGAIIAATTSEVNFTVTLTWKNQGGG